MAIAFSPAHSHAPGHCPCCFIIPPVILRNQSQDPNLDPQIRARLKDTYVETERLKLLREASRVATLTRPRESPMAAALSEKAEQYLFDCLHREFLPGIPVLDPATCKDDTIKAVYATTAKVEEFYRQVLGRRSINNREMDIVSSTHYRRNFDNAFWDGKQMAYGDGDGEVFIEFYKSPDVIGHELTHGVTQFESGLLYRDEPGALNESISDVFGAVFNQWLNKWPVTKTKGWLIGAGIMGPKSHASGMTCLRDMLTPAAQHCLSRQPDSYDDVDPTADVHINSGIPNHAFAIFAQAVGGNAWDKALKVWYAACIDRRLRSNSSFVEFAQLTIEAGEKQGGKALAEMARQAWQAVHLPLEEAVAVP